MENTVKKGSIKERIEKNLKFNIMKLLEILITPSYESTRDSMDFSEDDDCNGDAVLYQQGYDMDVMVVEPRDDFEIEEDFRGQISFEETQYKLIKIEEEWEDE